MEAFDNINETWVEPLKKGIEKLKDDWKVAINKTEHLKWKLIIIESKIKPPLLVLNSGQITSK